MTEKEMILEAFEWQTHIHKLASDAKNEELYHKRSKVLDWLIQQAERAQKNAQDLENMDRQLYSEQQQNKRYREALMFYADKNKYEGEHGKFWNIILDGGKTAREALGVEVNETYQNRND